MKHFTFKKLSSIILIVIIAVSVGLALIFMPLSKTQAEATAKSDYYAEYTAEIYANKTKGTNVKIADALLRVNLSYRQEYNNPEKGMFTVAVECRITPNQNKGNDIFRVDDLNVMVAFFGGNGYGGYGYLDGATVPTNKSEVSKNISFNYLPILGVADAKVSMKYGKATNDISNEAYQSATTRKHNFIGQGVKDEPVSVGFFDSFYVSGAQSTMGTVVISLQNIEIKGLVFAPNYEADNTEAMQISINFNNDKGTRNTTFQITNDTVNTKDTIENGNGWASSTDK